MEAIERSRASQADLGGHSHLNDGDDDSSNEGGGYAPDDFGGGLDDDDDDDDANFVGSRVAESFIHDGDHRFSSDSFQTTFEASQPVSQATLLLDAIASGDISGSQSNYEYFNSAALETIQGNNNMWAGSAHWKRMQRRKTQTTSPAASTPAGKGKKKGRTGTKSKASVAFVDVSNPPDNLTDLFRKPPKGKRGVDPLQLSKSLKSKYSKSENLLPVDMGIAISALTSLFLRPNASFAAETGMAAATASASASSDKISKGRVGFSNVDETMGWNGDSYDDGDGDDDDGPGYCFGGSDEAGNNEEDFVVRELSGIRKVEKVQVGYATVAKKVDVKRLKSDLWSSLEERFSLKGQEQGIDSATATKANNTTIEASEEQGKEASCLDPKPAAVVVSFQSTVREMQVTQCQQDVTLPFYFICVLHLANERGLELDSMGLEDFVIRA